MTQPRDFPALSQTSRKSAPLWTKDEVKFLYRHRDKPKKWISKKLGRSIAAITQRLFRHKWTRGVQAGASFTGGFVYYGPAGWDESQGPPCLLCEFNESKIRTTRQKCEMDRKECAHCGARIRWDVFNGGPERMAGDFFEVWPNIEPF